MKKLFILASTLLLAGIANAEVGFERGNDLRLTPVGGWADVMCYEKANYGRHQVYCEATMVSPGTHDKIVNLGAPVQADRVELVATRPDGSTRAKNEAFNSHRQESRAFNLVVSSLFQKSLVHVGQNEIAYTFLNGKQPVSSGSFMMNVSRAPAQRCESMYFSMHQSCSRAAICDEYYYRRPFCR